MNDFMLTPDAADLLKSWYDARQGRAIPTRRFIDPIRLRRWVGDISVIHVHQGQKTFYVSLHGAHVARHFGPDFNRKYLEDVIPEAALDDALLPYCKSMETNTPYYSIQHRTLDNRLFERLERMILPCSSIASDEVKRFLVWVHPMDEALPDSLPTDERFNIARREDETGSSASFFPLSENFQYQPSLAARLRPAALTLSS